MKNNFSYCASATSPASLLLRLGIKVDCVKNSRIARNYSLILIFRCTRPHVYIRESRQHNVRDKKKGDEDATLLDSVMWITSFYQ